MKKTYTIAQVLATPEGQYVSAEVFAVLSRATPPRGKGPWTANLTDSTGTIAGKFWGGDISHWEGKRIKLSGQGMQRKAYQNVPELSVGQKTDVSFAGAPGTAGQEVDAIPGDPVAPQSFSRPVHAKPFPALPDPFKPTGTPVNGQTVGMAVKAAVDIWLSTNPRGQTANLDWSIESIEQVEQIARDIVAISERIQSGESVPF